MPLVLADDSLNWGAASGWITAFLTGLASVYVLITNARRDARAKDQEGHEKARVLAAKEKADVIAEYQDYARFADQRFAELGRRIEHLEAEALESHRRERRCLRENAARDAWIIHAVEKARLGGLELPEFRLPSDVDAYPVNTVPPAKPAEGPDL